MQPPGPAQAIDSPGTQVVVAASAGGAQVQGPKALPAGLHTWLVEHPPGPVQATDCPGTQAVRASVEGEASATVVSTVASVEVEASASVVSRAASEDVDASMKSGAVATPPHAARVRTRTAA